MVRRSLSSDLLRRGRRLADNGMRKRKNPGECPDSSGSDIAGCRPAAVINLYGSLIAARLGSFWACPSGMARAASRLGVSLMDISTGLGLLAGACVLVTLIRFPLASIFHGLPLGARYAFTLRRTTQRELVEEIAGLAELARKQGPIGLEKVEIEDPFLAKGIRFVADGYDADFIRDNLERDRDIFLTHLDEGQKIYRAVGDCAPAFGMIGTLIGMVQMFANMTDPSKLGPFMAVALL